MNENKLTWVQRLKLYLFGHVYVEHRQQPGWKGPLPYYIFKCPEHGLVVDYPSGYNRILRCPLCTEARHAS